MDKLKGLVGAAGTMVEKSGWADKITQLKENYLNKVYDIGYRRFIVKKLIAEGGFGFVFLVRDVATERQYALKRMIVQDRERRPAVNQELSLMQALAKHPHVVSLEDQKVTDNRTELEVLMLMEYCSCSLLDYMNQNRLRNEQDIYEVFSQICLAVARLHSNNPPISHRDLKVENVLLGEDGKWKLCDFGSASTATYLPQNERERSVAEDDINRNTTMMYRAPEMVDLYRRQPINEKVDIWALGCILFKMAYLIDAFDGGLGIMNARYTFPEFRKTSTTFEEFIGFLLNPDPTARPNIQQVQERLAALRGVPAPRQTTPPPASRASGTPQSTHKPLPSQLAQQSPRPSSAPAQKPVADLLDWGDDPTPTPKPTTPPALHSSAPVPQPQKQASSNLFDALDWNQSSTTTPKPTTIPAKPNPQPTSKAPSIQQQRVPPPKANITTTKQDLPDLLDFSDPVPKPNPAISKYSGPPVASPVQYYSPQQSRTHNPQYNGQPNYYSPPSFTHQPHVQQQTNPGYDPLAQFAIPKQQSTGGLDDFDPLAKSIQAIPTTSPTPSRQLAPPKAALKPPPSKASTNHDSLISF